MKHYTDVVLGLASQPLPGATVQVNVAGTGNPAQIFSDDGVTTQPNPLTTDGTGSFAFYVADGRYDLVITSGTVNKILSDIEIADLTQSFPGDANWIASNIFVRGGHPWFDVRAFGAKGDVKQVKDAVITQGSGLVNSATAGFTSADLGKQVWGVQDATNGPELPHGVITIINSPTQITVSTTATQNDVNVTLTWGTDDTAAILAAAAAAVASINTPFGYPIGARSGVVFFPPGGFIGNANPLVGGAAGTTVEVKGSGKYVSVIYLPPDFPYSNTGTGNIIADIADCEDFGIDGSNALLTIGNIFLLSASHIRRVNIQRWQCINGGNNTAIRDTSDDGILEHIDIFGNGTAIEVASNFHSMFRCNVTGQDFGIQFADTLQHRIVNCLIGGGSNGIGIQDGPNSAINELTFVNCKIGAGASAVNFVMSGTIARFENCWIEGTPAFTIAAGVSVYCHNCKIVGDGAVCINNSGTFNDLGGNIFVGTLIGTGTYLVTPQEVARVDRTGLAASIAATTLYTVPANRGGLYRVSFTVVTTQAATTSSVMPALQLTWTDQDTSVVESNLALTLVNNGNAVGNYGIMNTSGGADLWPWVTVKAGTNIQYSTAGYSSTGAQSMQYAIHIRLEYLG